MTQTVTVLELRQRRCSLRYGVGACQADGPVKCLQTYETCDFKSAYNRNGELRWYFHKAGDPAPFTANAPSANEIYGPSIPILENVQTEGSRINLGAIRTGESPFGMRGTIQVTLSDFEFRNQFGDFYGRDIRASIGSLLIAWMGDAIPQMEMRLYRGLKGQTLAQMQVSRFDVINIDPPSGGKWTIQGYDPLHKALKGKAQFPRATDIRLVGDVDASTTAITVQGLEADISDHFGNTVESYARMGSEIIGYTGYSGSGGQWVLSNVRRGVLQTVAADHRAGSGLQRVGHFDNMQYWRIVDYLLENHTEIDPSLIPFAAQWVQEGSRWLTSLRGTGSFVSPQPVENVCGIAMRSGMFSIWWDAVAQQIKMRALRQPDQAPVLLNESQHLTAVRIIREPDQRLTRYPLYYGRGNPTVSLDDPTNFDDVRVRRDLEAEGPNFADGTVRSREIYDPLLRTDSNAVLVQAMQLQRYKKTPVYLAFRVARKDFALAIGDVVQIESENYVDRLGNPLVTSWEIIQGPDEIENGLIYEYVAQSFVLFTRPSFIMPNDSPNFANATDAQKVNACYISQNDGKMPDGSPGYVIQ